MKIKKYYNYCKRFYKSRNKRLVLNFLVQEIRNEGLISGIKDFLHKKNFSGIPNEHLIYLTSLHKVTILTTKHCLYIANLIQKHFNDIDLDCEIIFAEPRNGFADNLHFIIAPQIFKKLPRLYITIQMEQSVSSRWFNKSYFKILNKSCMIVDYSLQNISYLLDSGIPLQKLYYVPISYFPDYSNYIALPINTQNEIYDVVFYGDINNDRRVHFINAIKSRYNLKILNEVYGNELLLEVSKAKIVINIHYYENALLETTRIYECLSIDKLIISETSSDIDNHSNLQNIVDFVDIGDIDAMVKKISYWLEDDSRRQNKIKENKQVLQNMQNPFTYYFYRLCLSQNLIKYDTFYQLTKEHFNIDSNLLCLSLPESVVRRNSFSSDNKYGFEFFNGLRHIRGWIGCALSFKCMINKALDKKLDYIIICEDDVEFDDNFANRFAIVFEYLINNMEKWDIFMGIVSDLHPDTKISKIEDYASEKFVYINKMVGMVFNVYNKSIFNTILGFDETNYDADKNTIDRYLESSANLKIITTANFLVGHKEEQQSTIWGFQNTQYNTLIQDSKNRLNRLIKKSTQL